MNYTQLPDDILPKVRTWSAMQLAIWADVYTMGKTGMIYYRTNEQLAERWQTDERTVRRVVRQLVELGAVTAEQDGRRRILTAVLDFEERRRTKRSTVQADHGPTSPRTKQSAMEDQSVREGGPTGPQKGDQAVPQVEHRVDKGVEHQVEQRPQKQKMEIVMPWESDDFARAWAEWKEYKRVEKRFTFKSPKTEQASLHKLYENTEENEQLAIYTIGCAIANGWAGLHVSSQVKREFSGMQKRTGTSQLDRELEEFYATGKIQGFD